jgi:hypothetical protein|tara:strand:- start:275 stop:670 length:396 start_codon:yes stop_codon:yes gene_type:complete
MSYADNLVLRITKHKVQSLKPEIKTNSNGNTTFTNGKIKLTTQPFDATASSCHRAIIDIEGVEFIIQESCSNGLEVLIQTQGKKVVNSVRVNDKIECLSLIETLFKQFKRLFVPHWDNLTEVNKVRIDVER